MTLAQVRGYMQALGALEAERVRHTAWAVRAGMADEKGWKAWLKGAA